MALSLVQDQALVCLAVDLLLLQERAETSMRDWKVAFSMVLNWELVPLLALLVAFSMVLHWELVLSLALPSRQHRLSKGTYCCGLGTKP